MLFILLFNLAFNLSVYVFRFYLQLFRNQLVNIGLLLFNVSLLLLDGIFFYCILFLNLSDALIHFIAVLFFYWPGKNILNTPCKFISLKSQ